MSDPDGIPAAGESVAGIVLKSETVFLARRRMGGSIGGKWEFPGGKVEPGEYPVEALKREFMEELGVRIHVGSAIGQSEFEHDARQFVVTAYEVELEGEPRTLEEHISLGWFPVESLSEVDLPDSDRGLVESVLRYVKNRTPDAI